MKTIEGLKQLIASKHKPELAAKPGMVYQIWEEGEITLQKSGDLLWRRNLHMIEPGITTVFTKNIMPVQMERNGYAFIESKEVEDEIREYMKEVAKEILKLINSI